MHLSKYISILKKSINKNILESWNFIGNIGDEEGINLKKLKIDHKTTYKSLNHIYLREISGNAQDMQLRKSV